MILVMFGISVVFRLWMSVSSVYCIFSAGCLAGTRHVVWHIQEVFYPLVFVWFFCLHRVMATKFLTYKAVSM